MAVEVGVGRRRRVGSGGGTIWRSMRKGRRTRRRRDTRGSATATSQGGSGIMRQLTVCSPLRLEAHFLSPPRHRTRTPACTSPHTSYSYAWLVCLRSVRTRSRRLAPPSVRSDLPTFLSLPTSAHLILSSLWLASPSPCPANSRSSESCLRLVARV
ncbi:hypothetical protein DFH08DRAFT_831890 [Mycena albidolilacea]|uniref:Uncharacterized protein n=1 Tax=Mycena albidolilacea TaxID=1033008 RepID=A0AAD7F6L7_9AGAR|nr:hypothetical protein DFH08DRAFT_831890 [Mycena albidolilacea]